MYGARFDQLARETVSPPRAYRAHAVRSSRADIVDPIANHHRIARQGAGGSHGVTQQHGLVTPAVGELGAVHTIEMFAYAKVLEDAVRGNMGLRCHHTKVMSSLAQTHERAGNTRIECVLEHADIVEPHAVRRDGAVDGCCVGRGHDGAEDIEEGPANHAAQTVIRLLIATKLHQRVIDAADDARAGIGQRAVEIEKDVHLLFRDVDVIELGRHLGLVL